MTNANGVSLSMNSLALLLVMGTAGMAEAQVQRGDRVRILTVEGLTITGVVFDAHGDSIKLQAQDSPATNARSLPFAEVAYLERSTQRYRQFGRNFLITTGSIAGVVGALTAIAWKPCYSYELFGCLLHPESRSSAFVQGAVIGGALGVPIGVLVGLAIRYDRWEPTQIAGDKRSSLKITPRFDRGLGVTASFAF